MPMGGPFNFFNSGVTEHERELEKMRMEFSARQALSERLAAIQAANELRRMQEAVKLQKQGISEEDYQRGGIANKLRIEKNLESLRAGGANPYTAALSKSLAEPIGKIDIPTTRPDVGNILSTEELGSALRQSGRTLPEGLVELARTPYANYEADLGLLGSTQNALSRALANKALERELNRTTLGAGQSVIDEKTGKIMVGTGQEHKPSVHMFEYPDPKNPGQTIKYPMMQGFESKTTLPQIFPGGGQIRDLSPENANGPEEFSASSASEAIMRQVNEAFKDTSSRVTPMSGSSFSNPESLKAGMSAGEALSNILNMTEKGIQKTMVPSVKEIVREPAKEAIKNVIEPIVHPVDTWNTLDQKFREWQRGLKPKVDEEETPKKERGGGDIEDRQWMIPITAPSVSPFASYPSNYMFSSNALTPSAPALSSIMPQRQFANYINDTPSNLTGGQYPSIEDALLMELQLRNRPYRAGRPNYQSILPPTRPLSYGW